jgi:hypothetical protein
MIKLHGQRLDLLSKSPCDGLAVARMVHLARNYRYDRERIAALDKLRHDYVHGEPASVKLPAGDEDIVYLRQTDMFTPKIDPVHNLGANRRPA